MAGRARQILREMYVLKIMLYLCLLECIVVSLFILSFYRRNKTLRKKSVLYGLIFALIIANGWAIHHLWTKHGKAAPEPAPAPTPTPNF